MCRRSDSSRGTRSSCSSVWGPASAGRLKSARTLTRALAAAALIAIAVGGWGAHATLRARDELLTAMRIASQKVSHAQQEINRR